ncbi:hypothetical protein ABT010_41250 [Streptomyces sp. NPDC002668]
MNGEVAPLAGDEVPEVDELLAGALVAQGEAGARALGPAPRRCRGSP